MQEVATYTTNPDDRLVIWGYVGVKPFNDFCDSTFYPDAVSYITSASMRLLMFLSLNVVVSMLYKLHIM
jgi:hypothetical protein